MEYIQEIAIAYYPSEGRIDAVEIGGDSYRPPQIDRPSNMDVKAIARNLDSKDLASRT